MKKTDAQKRAVNRYNKKTYKRYSVNIKHEQDLMIQEYKLSHCVKSDSELFKRAIQYIIDNDIDLFI